jgi:hypothetical protein
VHSNQSKKRNQALARPACGPSSGDYFRGGGADAGGPRGRKAYGCAPRSGQRDRRRAPCPSREVSTLLLVSSTPVWDRAPGRVQEGEPIAPASDVFPSPGLCVCVSRSSSTEKPTRLAECSRLVERLNEPEAKHPSERLAGRTGKFTSSTGQSSRRVQHCSTRARPSKFISSVAG